MPKCKAKDGTQLYYKVVGKGEPLVLVAGGFCDHQVWDDIVEHLGLFYQVITYDHRGIGQSDAPDDDYSVSLLASDLNDLITHLKLPAIHLVGHSMGGCIAQYFAAHYQEKVKSLILLSSLLTMNETGYNFLNDLIEGVNSNPEVTRQQMPEKAGRLQTTHSIIQQATLGKAYDASSYIHNITAPTLVISGLQDIVMNEDETYILASSIPTVQKTVMLDCNHMIPREMPERLVNELLSFLDNLSEE